MSLAWETVACDWCGTAQGELVFEGPDRLLRLPGKFRFERCPTCGLLRQNPRLAWESLKDYYSEQYEAYAPLNRDRPHAWLRLDKRYGFWKHVRSIERHQKGGRLLDVGCGTGLFLEEAMRSGRWQVEGVEPTEQAATYARNGLQVPIHQGRFTELDMPPGAFDVITLWNVLEHVGSPTSDLRQAHQLLKPGGWLVFSIPYYESWGRAVFGPYWVGWDLPRHLYVFPMPLLRQMLAELGFALVETRCLSTSYDLMGHNLDFWSQSWRPGRSGLRRLMLGIYHTLPVRAALIPPLWALDRLKRADTLTVFARKH